MTVDRPAGDNLIWFKSSYSGGNETECLEVAMSPAHRVLVRDSKQPEYAQIGLGAPAWRGFIASLDEKGQNGGIGAA